MIVKRLKAIASQEEQAVLDGVDCEFMRLQDLVAQYIKEMTETGVPGEWHFQQFSVERWDEEFGYVYVVALFNPDNKMVEYIGQDYTPYKSYADAQWQIENGDYSFGWEELSESTARHTQAWNELDPTPESDCPSEGKATTQDLW